MVEQPKDVCLSGGSAVNVLRELGQCLFFSFTNFLPCLYCWITQDSNEDMNDEAHINVVQYW